ncbi:pentapeptide repeat-containing protein [Microbispora bryophytorum]|uniref:pentapeptide repeat-containing protein n=1 Tax=Microbispora bryophytorum TaxID=1460882 RepID=UPI0037178B43
MRIGRALVLASAAAVALLGVVIVGGLVLFGVQSLKPEAQVSAGTLFELLKIAFAVVAGIGGLVALVVAYRRQKVAEAAQGLAEQAEQRAHVAELRAQRGEQREATKLHNDRFATAAGQLGHDAPAVRLAGAHALAGLADDAPTRELRQTCIDVLCAYLRMPYSPEPTDEAPETERLLFTGLREVRHTIIRLIGAHLREDAPVSWQGHDLDFTGVMFDGGDFLDAMFSGGTVSFRRATFCGATVDFRRATFPGGTVDFRHAKFSGGTVSFDGATFSGGDIDFHRSTFSSGEINFYAATFSSGEVSFLGATFPGATVDFGYATFSGGTVDLRRATFSSGGISFFGATFSSGTVTFDSATFSGSTVSFRDATFSGCTVDLRRAKFSSGSVDLSNPRSWEVPPAGLPEPTPVGLLLPADQGAST